MAAGTAMLLYDSECGFCRAATGLILFWDRHQRLQPLALQDPAAARRLSGLAEEERMTSWHLIGLDGSRHSGAAAFAPLFALLPRGTRLAHLANRFPAAADRLYALVAANRDHLAALLPPRLCRNAEQKLESRSDKRPEGDVTGIRDPHHVLNNPVVDDPDLTEWPDPYETREDPRDPPDPDGKPFGEAPHPATGSISTSEPHPSQDPEAGGRWQAPKRDKLDD